MARQRRRRNPETQEIPYGEWVPTHAVRFKSDGTVELMTEAGQAHNPGGYHYPDLVDLINTYNEASSPSVMRTEEEHEEANAIARSALRKIRQYYREGRDYRELSSGALWPISNPGRRRRNQYAYPEARREQMLHELASDLADMVEAGEMTDMEANEWYNRKADQWAQGLS